MNGSSIDSARDESITAVADIDFEVDAESGSGNPDDLASAYSELFSDEPVEAIDQRLVRRLVDDLNNAYEETGRAFRIVEVAGGFQFATIRDFGEYVALLSKEKLRRRLSPAALETLAIIAFRQPISKPEIEAIRGVNSDQVLLSLLEKNLVCITGRSESVGRPLLYGTSEDFLRIFGLNSLSDLPKLREIEELMEDNAYSAERLEVVSVPLSSDAEEIEAAVGAAGHIEDNPDEDASIVDDASRRDDETDSDSADGDDTDNTDAAIDGDWVDEVGGIGSDDGGMTHDSDAHVLDEVEAIDARDDAYDT
ncbi:MAG: SMC-Scp complex subunit ScpB, partial [bacterium]|nr:SMC-Scp complex subunit ScpB [Candidatus Kapabacteria bacterium]